MNATTTRYTPPAATPRTGPTKAALPSDPALDAILADPRLGPTAKLIIVALVKAWAWSKDHCWPSDRTIAARIGKSPGHVQRCLRELEHAGHVRRERTDRVPSGRVIWLAWRCPGGAGAQPVPAPARSAPPAPARDERVVVVKEEVEREGFAPEERQRQGPAPAPPAVPAPPSAPVTRATPIGPAVPRPAVPVPITASVPLAPEQQARLGELPATARDEVLAWLATGDPILMAEARKRLAPPRPRPEPPGTLPEVLGRIREDPAFPALAADWLARAFDDRGSYSGFKARCEEAWRGELPVEHLVSAFGQATGPRARNPGALFMHVLTQRSP